jgi:tetratricopeptide (TPR) repeat protein
MYRWNWQLGLLLLVLMAGCHSKSDNDSATGAAAENPVKPPASPSTGNPNASTNNSSFDRKSAIESAERFMRDGRTAQAAAALQRVLLADPEDVEVLFRLANVQAAMGKLDDAVTLLESIPEDHPEAGLAALGQSADWCLQLERYDQAEQRYKKVLQRVPQAAEAHRQLAYLYNRQGRTHEAAVHIRELCKLANVRQDELQSLILVSHAVYDDPNSTTVKEPSYAPIGPAGTARKQFTDSQFSEAAEVLQEVIAAGEATPAVAALYGRVVAEAQDDQRFLWWLATADDAVKQQAEYWAAVGTYLLNHRRHQEAIRALAEAIDRDPTDAASMRRMNQALLAVGEPAEAQKWHDRFFTLRDVTVASNRIGDATTPDLESFATVADGLDKLQRPLEATMWRLLAAFYRHAPPAEKDQLNKQLAALVAAGQTMPDQNDRLCGLNLEQYPLPHIDVPAAAASPPPERPVITTTPVKAVFENIAASVGLDHAFQIAGKQQTFAFAIYQQLGGGVAVLDFDLDGWPDLYFAQGGSDPPTMTGQASNSLYRNQASQLVNVTDESATIERRYSIGVTAGDWNQDGFADLVVASIGAKTLLINNGDGTFQPQTLDVNKDLTTLPSSLALADVSGDSLPDVVALHYVEDSKMLVKPAINQRGQVQTMSPTSFAPGTDRLFINDGTGKFASQAISAAENAASTGLGVIVADLDGKPGNEIFVGNDVRANHLWSRAAGSTQWIDTASLSGCALGGGGLITASMGIAADDFDGSGTLDLHVTNFYLEPASFFLNRDGAFEDRCIQYKLYRDSSDVLGFGTQSVDYSNDGRPDLVVTNGNIEKAAGEPFQQPPQLFANLGSEFRITEVADTSSYWSGKYLGRSLARLDFDRDGRSDLVITHLDAPSALLLNKTETGNHWLKVKLVGTRSERDAIGAKVTLRAGDQTWTNWAVAGDGYLCRNEAVIPFGLGPVTEIDAIEVQWPGGQQQTFTSVPADQEIMLIEHQPEAYSPQ